MSEQEYIDYFENLASQHNAIGHTPDQPRFYVAKDNNREEIDKALRNKLRLPAVVLDQYYDDVDRTSDNFRLTIQGGITILVKCTIQDPKDVRRAHNQARQIAMSFINRMYKDCRSPVGTLYSKRIVPSTTYSGEPAAPIGEIAAGWGYPFEWTMPTSVAVDSADWADL